MYSDLNSGKRYIDPMKAYVHNRLIKRLFDRARRQAWAQVKQNSEARALMQEQKHLEILNRQRLRETSNLQPLLQMSK